MEKRSGNSLIFGVRVSQIQLDEIRLSQTLNTITILEISKIMLSMKMIFKLFLKSQSKFWYPEIILLLFLVAQTELPYIFRKCKLSHTCTWEHDVTVTTVLT